MNYQEPDYGNDPNNQCAFEEFIMSVRSIGTFISNFMLFSVHKTQRAYKLPLAHLRLRF